MGMTEMETTVAVKPIQALVIQPDSTYEVREVDQKLATYKGIVGGYIEAIPAGPGAVMWCNEEGKVHGLPRNSMATYLWWKLEPEMEGMDDLRGPVIVTGPADEDGDSLPVLASVVDLYRRMEAVRMFQDPDPANGVEPAP